MRVMLDIDALGDLGLDDADIEIRLAVPPASIDLLRTYLGRILTYGRPKAQPALLRL